MGKFVIAGKIVGVANAGGSSTLTSGCNEEDEEEDEDGGICCCLTCRPRSFRFEVFLLSDSVWRYASES